MKKILTIILSIVLLPSVALAQFTVSAGGTGHRSVSSGSILFGSTSLRLGTSSDLYWDYFNSHLGISTTSPWAKLSIGSQSASPFSFAVGSSTRPQFSITKDGNTIVGNTTTPSALVTLEATNGTDYPNDLLFSVVGSLPEYAYDEILEQDVQVATDTSKLFSISERGGVTINSRVQAPAKGALVINSSTSSTPTNVPHPQAALQISGDTGEFASIYLTSYGDNSDAGSYRSIINLRGTRGTAAAPTANQAGDEIGRISARPYTGSTFAGSNASISFFAAENTSSTNQGGYMAFRTTPTGSVAGGSYTNPPERIRVQPSGGLSVGNPTWNATDPGHGSLSVYSKLGIGSTTPYSSLSIVGTSTDPLIAAYSSANSPYLVLDTNGKMGIGTSTPTTTLTVINGISSLGTLGSDLISNGSFTSNLSGWTGTGWAWHASGVARHTAGNSAPLVQSALTPTIGDTYKITFTVSNRTAGFVEAYFGGVYGKFAFNGTYTDYITARSGAAFQFYTDSDFDGDIDNVSVYKVTTTQSSNFETPVNIQKTLTVSDNIVFAQGQPVRIGYGAGANDTTGTYNTQATSVFIGYNAGYNNTVGHGTCIGYYACFSNTTSGGQDGVITAVGKWAGYSNTTGHSAFFGNATGLLNTTSESHCFGDEACRSNTVDDINGFGYYSLNAQVSGNATGFGHESGLVGTTTNGTYFGYRAGVNNFAKYFTGGGYQAGFNNTYGSSTVWGARSGFSNTTGTITALGGFAGMSQTTGRGIYIGDGAGYGENPANAPVTDTGAILIGDKANRSVASASTLSNYIGIGDGVLIDKSNQVKLGTTTITETQLFGNVGLGTTSPYAKLSVVGQVVASYFTATSSTASTFPYASTTALTASGNVYVDSNLMVGTTTIAATDKFAVSGGNTIIRNLTPQTVWLDTAVVDNNLGIRAQAGKGYIFRANNDSSLSSFLTTFDLSTGYVGFGTSSAAARITLNRGTTAADGINFGSDVTLYRSTTNTLKTDDDLSIGSGVYLESGSSGRVYANGGLVNLSSANNSRVRTTDGGSIIDRNIADTNAALTVTQLNAGSTGNILELRNSSATTTVFTQAGKLGLGTSTPFAKFGITGTSGLSTLPVFQVASSTNNPVFTVNGAGHIITGGGTPSVSSCGTSPSISGNDTSGTVTVGSGVVTSCTITFATTRTNTPRVVGVVTGGGLNIAAGYSSKSTSAVTFSFATTIGGGTFDYYIVE